jgi:hypothetical protein
MIFSENRYPLFRIMLELTKNGSLRRAVFFPAARQRESPGVALGPGLQCPHLLSVPGSQDGQLTAEPAASG